MVIRETANIIRACGALPNNSHSALPAATLNTTLPGPQNLSVLKTCLPTGFQTCKNSDKVLKPVPRLYPRQFLCLYKKNKERILSIPSRTRHTPGVTNHQHQITITNLNKPLIAIIFSKTDIEWITGPFKNGIF